MLHFFNLIHVFISEYLEYLYLNNLEKRRKNNAILYD